MEVKVKVTLVSKSLINDPFGEKLIKLEFAEEREMPGPIIVQQGNNPLMKDIIPIVSQVLRSMPFFAGRKATIQRLVLYLTEDEWDKITDKPDIGDEVTVVIKGRKIEIKKE